MAIKPIRPAMTNPPPNDNPNTSAMFASGGERVASVTSESRLPPPQRLEFAFTGRSNCGKSSLLNTLFKRRTPATVSKRPGCTRSLNFYALGSQAYGVDMPGYGYAESSRTTRTKWRDLSWQYFAGRPNLQRVFVLIDMRRGLMEPDDLLLARLSRYAISCDIVLTKSDKVAAERRDAVQAATDQALQAYASAHPSCFVTSSVSGSGIILLRQRLATLAAIAAPVPQTYEMTP